MNLSISPNISWTEYLDGFKRYKPSQDLASFIQGNDRENTSSLLCHEDMKIYGLHPLQEELILVTCNFCKKLIKIEALSHHYENNHKYAICNETAQVQFPIPSHDYSSDKISLKQQTKPQTSENVVLESDYEANLLKEQHLNRQSELRMRDRKRKYQNSHNCKPHPISLRSNPKGRIKPYDNLLVAHKGRIQPEMVATTTENTSLFRQSDLSEETTSKGYNEKELYTETKNEYPFDHHYRRFHPIPAAVCAFGARSLIPGTYIFTRKCDKLCASLIFAIEGCGSHK